MNDGVYTFRGRQDLTQGGLHEERRPTRGIVSVWVVLCLAFAMAGMTLTGLLRKRGKRSVEDE